MNPCHLSALASTLIVLGAFIPQSCPAEVMLASPFTDHAVLQRSRPVPIWGHATPGEAITVRFRGQSHQTVTAADGRWSVALDPMPADAEGRDLFVTGKNTVVLNDVVVGEVWLASGQSNMEFPLNQALHGKDETAAATFPLIRHLKIEHSPSDSPVDRVKTSGWQPSIPETAANFSAVGYFFARELAAKLNVPIGIINSSWGGTPIESWTAEPVLRTTKAWAGFDARWQEALKIFPQKLAEYPALDIAWRKAEAESRTTGKPLLLPWPHPPVGPGTAYAPGALFNGMIAPIAPYALRGALWYQGESNADHAGEYAELFPAMIRDWRKQWGQGDFPFLFVQLPNYANGNPTARDWAALREAQNAALKLRHVGAAIAIDVGDASDIHPSNKQPVGLRLALLAEEKTYDLSVESSGPVFKSAERDGSTMRVKFSHAQGLRSRTPKVTGFEIAGADKIFHPATAKLNGKSVIASAVEVPEPVAVRYAWTNNPAASLFNREGLPAAPFRSDAW